MAQDSRSVREIPIENLTVSTYQVRKREVDRNLAELIDNIRVHGQLEPILVAPTDQPDQFEIIAGQRRWLAMRELGYETINASILDEELDGGTVRAISISENLIRRDVGSKDLIDACTNLYRKYGSIKAVAEDLGLPQTKVRSFVKFDRLRPELKQHVESGELDIRTALKVEDHCSQTNVDSSQVEKILHDIKDMTNAQKAHYFRSARSDGNSNGNGNGAASKAAAGANGNGAQQPGNVHQILATLPREDYQLLRRWADSRNLTQDQAAARIIGAFFRNQKQQLVKNARGEDCSGQ